MIRVNNVIVGFTAGATRSLMAWGSKARGDKFEITDFICTTIAGGIVGIIAEIAGVDVTVAEGMLAGLGCLEVLHRALKTLTRRVNPKDPLA